MRAKCIHHKWQVDGIGHLSCCGAVHCMGRPLICGPLDVYLPKFYVAFHCLEWDGFFSWFFTFILSSTILFIGKHWHWTAGTGDKNVGQSRSKWVARIDDTSRLWKNIVSFYFYENLGNIFECKYENRFPETKREKWENIFPTCTSREEIDLVDQLVVYNPSMRLTANQVFFK